MAYSLSPLLKPRFFVNATNKPLVGGKLYTYLAETTTPATTYSNDTGTENTNPIILDANGECNLYLDDDKVYRLILKDANDVTYFDKDRVSSIGGGDYKVLTFNTIADLRLKIGSEKEPTAQTSGYYAAGDGGGNSFYWDSTSGATDNGGTIIKPTFVSGAGRWLAVDTSYINVKQFGAVGDGVADDTAAFMSAFAKIKTSGGAIYVPAGVYKVSSTLDFFVASPRGGRIFGDGHGATWIHWTGGAGTLFSNEQVTANQFQYGFIIEDMTLATIAPGGSLASPLAGSIGVHAEMLQKLWGMRNVSIVGFETNLDIGVHAEAGMFSKCQFAYGDTGVNAYGDQADCLVFHACWFTGNKTRGLILSSPRPVVDSCFFGPAIGFSDTANYSDIQIGWQAVRAGDIGKSSYLTAAAGNAAAKAKIINNAFEGDGSAPQIIIKNIDTDTKRFADLVFENNSFASYGRPCAVRIEKAYDAVTFRDNRMSKSAGSTASFLDITAGTMGELVVDERHITDIWPSQEQLWAYGASYELFNDNAAIASSVMYQLGGGSWNVNNEGSADGITLVDLDFDGQQNIKVTYGSLTGVPGVRIRHPSCPTGWVYVAFGIEQSSGALAINVDAKNGSGVTLFSRTTLPVSKGKRRVVFGFNNPTLQNIDIRVYPRPGTTSGSFVISEPLIKHGDGSAQSQSLVDTKTGMRFTQRLNQIHDWAGRIPFAELADWSNLATGRWFVGSAKQTTINNVGGYSAGATSIIVADGTKVAVGDYLYFKPATASGLSNIHRATATTGNKVNSVSSNTIGLATGLPYAVPDGGSVIACPVYQRAASTKL